MNGFPAKQKYREWQVIVKNTLSLSGTITIPSSKSQNIRALFFGLLAKGRTTLDNVLESEDTRDAIRVCQMLGANFVQYEPHERIESQIIVDSEGAPLRTNVTSVHTGNSGITTRFTLPLLGYRQNYEQPVIFDCGPQMRERPIQTLVDALRCLGMQIDYLEKNGSCPLQVHGRLLGGKTEVNGLSSQYLSALLMALPCATQASEIRVSHLHERPYVEMTLQWLQSQGIQFEHQISQNENEDIFKITANQRYQPFHKKLTGDFSSASYFIAAGVLFNKTIEIQGLDMQDPQGDKRLVEILQSMGAEITVNPHSLIIKGGTRLQGIDIDGNDIPDLLPTLAVIGAAASDKTTIRNVTQARIKETDRIHSMAQGLSRLGAIVEEYTDGIRVYQSPLKGNLVEGFHDHRTVMALTLAGLLAEGQTHITGAHAVAKTFPQFFSLMQSLGADLDISDDFK